MKTLLAIIITATLSFGCATLESEQTTIDFAGGETTSTSSTPTPTVTNWSGTKQLGSSLGDVAHGISTDSSGNVYITGYAGSGLDGNTRAGTGYDHDLFIVKYDNGGIKQWTQQLGSSFTDRGYGISTDSSGNVYVTGHTWGGLDGNTNAGSSDLFVVKYDSGGIKQWTQQLGSSSSELVHGISTDSSDNVYVTGYTFGSLDGSTNFGTEDLFVVKYDSGGIKQWTQQLGSSSPDHAHGISTDSSGNVYVTGHTWGGLDGNTNAGSSDLFVVKYDSDGIKQWTQQLGTSFDDYAQGIITDPSGNVYVTGYTWGGLDGNTNVGSDDLFVVKYDSDGIKQWTQQLGTSSPDHAYGISTDSSGNVYVTGSTWGGLDGNTNAGSSDLFVVKYDSDGIKQWTQQLGTYTYDEARGISTDLSGNAYVTGYTQGDLDGNTHTGGKGMYSGDLFVVKYDTNGNKQ